MKLKRNDVGLPDYYSDILGDFLNKIIVIL